MKTSSAKRENSCTNWCTLVLTSSSIRHILVVCLRVVDRLYILFNFSTISRFLFFVLAVSFLTILIFNIFLLVFLFEFSWIKAWIPRE